MYRNQVIIQRPQPINQIPVHNQQIYYKPNELAQIQLIQQPQQQHPIYQIPVRQQEPIQIKQMELNRINQPHYQIQNSQEIQEYKMTIEKLNHQLTKEVINLQNELKKFIEEFENEIKNFELNIAENDFTKLFFQELDRKALNLQNHLKTELSNVQLHIDQQQQSIQTLFSNLKTNITDKIDDEVKYYKSELNALQPQVENKIDRDEAAQLMQLQVNEFYAELNKQVVKIKGYFVADQELLSVRGELQSKIEEIEKIVKTRVSMIEKKISETQENQQRQNSEKKQLIEQINLIKKQMHKTFEKQKLQIVELSQEKDDLQFQCQKFSQQVQSQQELIKNLEQSVKSCFYMKKENVSLYSDSTKPEMFVQQFSNRGNNIINLDEFVDFHEQSLTDSINSNNEEYNLSNRQNPFVNKLVDEELKNAIKRRLIYNNPNNANVKLDCVLSQNGYLIDKETGLYILDLNGSPFQVTHDQVSQLLEMNLIRVSQ